MGTQHGRMRKMELPGLDEKAELIGVGGTTWYVWANEKISLNGMERACLGVEVKEERWAGLN